jgi:hypothetical protein
MFCFRLLQFASHKLFFNTIVYVGFLIYICSHMKTLEQIVGMMDEIKFDLQEIEGLIKKHLDNPGKADMVSNAYFDALVEAKVVAEEKLQLLNWVIEL